MRLCVVCAAVALSACSVIRQPGDPGYPYNLSGDYRTVLEIGSEEYTGTTKLRTGRGGLAVGPLEAAGSRDLNGIVAASISGDRVVLRLKYAVPGGTCTGTAEFSGHVARGGGELVGEFRSSDACLGAEKGSLRLVLAE